MSTNSFTLTEEQNKILDNFGNQLIYGGPGSGKTTIAILKAAQWIKKLNENQKVLFLSFARATVSRIIEAIDENSLIDKDAKKKIEVDTYHSFFWRIIKTHGYLLGLPRKVTVLSPTNEAVELSYIRKSYGKTKDLTEEEKIEKNSKEAEAIKKLAYERGEIAFDLFAEFTYRLLNESNKILSLLSILYPVIILDEFQDTNLDQWKVIQCLGKKSFIIALADPEQRIYDFIGADPERINQYRETIIPVEFDLKSENHRSIGTEIIQFGNDIINGIYKDKYEGINIKVFPSNENQALFILKAITIQTCNRLKKNLTRDWTLAILVPTKKLMYQVSNWFNQETIKQPSINHYAVIDIPPAILAAEIIAYLLQPIKDTQDLDTFIRLICNFYNGKGGDTPTKKDIEEAISIKLSFDKQKDKIQNNEELPKNSKIKSLIEGFKECSRLKFSGNPYEDWLTVRDRLESSNCLYLKIIASEAKNVRLLKRGTHLRETLSQNWRENGYYKDALEIVKQAFIREHFSISQNPEKGIVIMNMHKAKGKQFDEVIIFEGWPKRINKKIFSNPDRIVIGNQRSSDLIKYKYNLRVSVTRAKFNTTIMTPKDDPCVLLP